MKKLVNIAKKGLSIRLFLKHERKKSEGVQSSIKNLSKGFLSVSENIYNFSTNNPEDYLSDWARISRASKINNHQKVILDDKILFHFVESKNPSVLPLLYFIKKNKIWRKIKETYEVITEEQFFEEISWYKNGLIIKPSTGGGGNGISKVESINGEIIFSGDCKGKARFLNLINSGQDFVITEVLKQTGKLSEIYPHSTNSLRVLVMRDSETGKPFIARAVQRIGTSLSGIVDNWSAGGLSIDVDTTTGKMGEGAIFSSSGFLDWKRIHPDTNFEFYGVQICDWEEIVKDVLDISEKYFFLSYIGWDVVPMQKGRYILEGNTNSDVNLLQIHRGLLQDPQIQDFYRNHKVIK